MAKSSVAWSRLPLTSSVLSAEYTQLSGQTVKLVHMGTTNLCINSLSGRARAACALRPV